MKQTSCYTSYFDPRNLRSIEYLRNGSKQLKLPHTAETLGNPNYAIH